VPADVQAELAKLQSVALCANTAGQVVLYLQARPPAPGDPSYPLWARERREVLEQLALKAGVVEQGLNAVAGIHCQPVAGAMYAFPSIELPPGVTDGDYCMALLEETGICVVDGSGFGQRPGTWHLRTTILPPLEQVREMVRRMGEFHARFTRRAAEGR
jgi:aspartate/methionine/tyrosine aminotransferase